MSLNSQEDHSTFIDQLDELINTVENKENHTFNSFCEKFGHLDNFISFKQAYINFLKSTTSKELLNKLYDEQFFVNFWLKKGFVHESLLREHQQRRLLKAILKKVNAVTKELSKNK